MSYMVAFFDGLCASMKNGENVWMTYTVVSNVEVIVLLTRSARATGQLRCVNQSSAFMIGCTLWRGEPGAN